MASQNLILFINSLLSLSFLFIPFSILICLIIILLVKHLKKERTLRKEKEVSICPQCGSQIMAGKNFCTKCGTKINNN